MRLRTDLSANFRVNRDAELPPKSTDEMFHFPEDRGIGARTILEFWRSGENWLGVFHEDPFRTRCYEVLSMPDPDKAMVVVGGKGFIVDTRNPAAFEVVALPGITQVEVYADEKMILVANAVTLAAYDASGMVWITPRLVLSGLEILSVGEVILCRGNLPIADAYEFEVRSSTGRVVDSIVVEFVDQIGSD